MHVSILTEAVCCEADQPLNVMQFFFKEYNKEHKHEHFFSFFKEKGYGALCRGKRSLLNRL